MSEVFVAEQDELPETVNEILDLYEELIEQGLAEDAVVAIITEKYPDHMEILRALIPPVAGEGEDYNPQDGIS